MKVVNLKGYMCDKCGKIYMDKYMAEICCKQYYCEECGKPTPKYIMRCEECQKKSIYNKAKKMTYEEYIKQYPDYPIWDMTDQGECYWELEDYIEHIVNETEPPYPTYCFGSTKERLEIDIENVIEDINIDMEDGCGVEPDKELRDFINKWNEKNGRDIYYCDTNTIILIDWEDFKNVEKN